MHPWRIGAGILATLVAVPVLLGSAANGDGVAIETVTTSTTVAAASTIADEESLLADVDATALFEAGTSAQAPVAAARAASAQPPLASTSSPISGPPPSEPAQAPTSQPSTTDAPPATEAPTTAPPTTAAPTTQPPTTPAPTTAPPTTAAPTTAPPAEPAPAPTEPAPAEAPVEEAPVEEQPVEEVPAEPAPAPAQPTPEQWEALRQCESSGNYSIVSANGLYHGAYQFLPSTWDSVARSVGRTDLVGVLPSQAAPADQDAMALALWQQRGNTPWPHCGKHLPPGP